MTTPDWTEKAREIIASCVGVRAAQGHTAWRSTLARELREAYELGATDMKERAAVICERPSTLDPSELNDRLEYRAEEIRALTPPAAQEEK